MPRMPAAPKDPFEALDSDFKDAVAAMSPADINKRIAEVAKNEQDNQTAKAADQDLVERADEVKLLSGPYDKKTKQHKLILKAFSSTLKDKGIANFTSEDLNRRIAEVAKAEEMNQKAKEEDSALNAAKEDYKAAGEQYKEATKLNRLRIKYCMRCLGDKGAA